MKTKKLIYSLFTCSAFLLASCSNEEEIVGNETIGGGDKMVVSISNEEALSLVSNNAHTLSDDEVLKAITVFEQQSDKTTRTTISNNAKIIRNYKLACNSATTRGLNSKDSIEFSLIDLGIDKTSGIAIVCRDSRYPEVLAYVPSANMQTYQTCTPMQMMINRSQDVAIQYIEKCNSIDNTTREKALDKVCKTLEITKEQFDFAKYRSRIFIEDYDTPETRSSLQDPSGTILTSVGPLCGTTRLIQGWPCNQFIETTKLEKYNTPQHNGHFPAGCVNVALATMCSYIQPTIYSPDLKRNINWNNVINSYFNPFGFESSQYDQNTPQAKEVGYLLKLFAEKTHTSFGENGESTSTNNAASYMRSIGVNMSSSTTDLNYFNIRTSLSNLGLVYCTGSHVTNTRSDGSGNGHAWVIDGLQIRKPLTKYELQNFHCYANCKFGWIEWDFMSSYDGWYLFDTNGSINFTFDDGYISSNLRCVPNIRKY